MSLDLLSNHFCKMCYLCSVFIINIDQMSNIHILCVPSWILMIGYFEHVYYCFVIKFSFPGFKKKFYWFYLYNSFVLWYPGSFSRQSYYWKNGANLSYMEAQPVPILCQLTCHRFLFTSCVSCDVSNIWTSGLYFNKFWVNFTTFFLWTYFFIYYLCTKLSIIWNVK